MAYTFQRENLLALWAEQHSLYTPEWEHFELEALRQHIDCPRQALEHAPELDPAWPFEALETERPSVIRKRLSYRLRDKVQACALELQHTFAALDEQLTMASGPHFGRCPMCHRSVRSIPDLAGLTVGHEAPVCNAWLALVLPRWRWLPRP